MPEITDTIQPDGNGPRKPRLSPLTVILMVCAICAICIAGAVVYSSVTTASQTSATSDTTAVATTAPAKTVTFPSQYFGGLATDQAEAKLESWGCTDIIPNDNGSITVTMDADTYVAMTARQDTYKTAISNVSSGTEGYAIEPASASTATGAYDYALCDMDGDGTPELIVRADATGLTTCSVFTYVEKDGQYSPQKVGDSFNEGVALAGGARISLYHPADGRGIIEVNLDATSGDVGIKRITMADGSLTTTDEGYYASFSDPDLKTYLDSMTALEWCLSTDLSALEVTEESSAAAATAATPTEQMTSSAAGTLEVSSPEAASTPDLSAADGRPTYTGTVQVMTRRDAAVKAGEGEEWDNEMAEADKYGLNVSDEQIVVLWFGASQDVTAMSLTGDGDYTWNVNHIILPDALSSYDGKTVTIASDTVYAPSEFGTGFGSLWMDDGTVIS